MNVIIKGNVNCCQRKGEDNPITVKVDIDNKNVMEMLNEEYYY